MNNRTTAFQCALNLLARRDHSEYKLTQKLSAKNYPQDDIKQAIEQCKKAHYLNDENYASLKIEHLINRGFGERKIRYELQQDNIDSELIDQLIIGLEIDWFELAYQVSEKKFSTTHQKLKVNQMENDSITAQKFKQKKIRFLQSRGFDFEQIQHVLSVSKSSQNNESLNQ